MQAARAAIAAGLSWFVAAQVVGNPIPVFAPLAALLTVQTTLWESVSRGAQRVAGVVVGVIVAFGFARLVGIHAWSIGLIIFAALLIGRALRLGVHGSIQVPVSALLVLAVGGTRAAYAGDRVIDTVIGAGIGVIVSLVPAPSSAVTQASEAVASLATQLGQLLGSINDALRVTADRDAPLRNARLLAQQTADATRVVDQATTSIRLNPATRSSAATITRLAESLETLRLVGVQVRGIARSVADAEGPIEPLASLTGLLDAVRTRIDEWADQVARGTKGEQEEVPKRLFDEVIATARDPALTGSSAATAIAIAVDARRICEELARPPRPAPPRRAPGTDRYRSRTERSRR